MKKVLALLLVFVLALGVFAACSKQDDGKETPQVDETAATEESADGLQIAIPNLSLIHI